MNAFLTTVALLLVSASPTFSQEAKEQIDPVLASLQARLEAELRELDPSPEIEIPDGYAGKGMILRYKTRKYMVYPNAKGRIGSELQETEGPADEGILLRVHVQKKGELNQAAVPQTIRQPYWSTYLNVYPVAGSEKQIYLALSYRGRTDKELISKLQKIAEQDAAVKDQP